ncbi:OmpH family outer membrane protein [Marinobacter confluentis]|uniref:OmpH family outer membrane protein n=1 Tax=Marinobacter confluentis TaxID=1697557 RepID=A0A4Z1BJ78_9GAMM|nr:OmpH family outer membrane protein [Marinobacter confluentis]TGN39817.1 OmpH family outer membrane protein [Marinobacter confluentis]
MLRLPIMATLVALLMSTPVVAETRIGVVDLRQALFSSKEAQAFSAKLQQDFSGEEAKVRETQEEARALKERLEQDGAMMNESERNRLAAQFQEKVQQFNALKQRLDSTVANRKQSFLEEARPDVDAAVQELVDEHDLDMILPSEAVVYVKPDMNLTAQLLEKLDR